MISQRLFSVTLTALLAPAVIAQITPGNLIVVRTGDGSAVLSSAATALFLEEFTVGGVAVQTMPMPTTAVGPQFGITNSGSATSEGYITQSADGRYLVTVGYAAALGTSNVVSTTSASTPRVVSRIGLDGTIDTSTALTDSYSGNNIRSGTSLDGSQFWTGGTGSTGNRGVCYVGSLGATTSTQLSTSVTNLRVVNIFNDQLYASSQSGAFVGLNTVGVGLPTTSGEVITRLTGFPGPGVSPNQYDYFFADASTVYVADERTAAAGGGIQKWTESAGTWTLAFTIAPGIGCRGLTGIVDQSGTTLFATTSTTSGNQLVSVLDTGPASTFTTLATAPANTAFRGVRFVRTPSSVSFAGTGCTTSAGIPTVGTTGGAPVSGNANFALTCGNAPAFAPYIAIVGINQILGPGAPLSFAGFPPCAVLYSPPDALVNATADGAGNGLIPLGLVPADSSFWGLPFTVQNAVYDPAFYPSYAPFYSFGFSDGMQVVIGN